MRISFLSNWIKRWRIWYYKRLEALDVYDLSQPLGIMTADEAPQWIYQGF